MTPTPFTIDADALAAFCRKNHIRRLAVFGSVLRDDFNDDSDIDVIVEFVPGARIGWDFVRIQDELTVMLGRRVDLVTPGSLRPAFRDAVLHSLRDLYVAA